MADARIDVVCDLVKAAIVAALPNNDMTKVTAEEPAPTILSVQGSTQIVKRTVFVFADGYGQVEQLSRGHKRNAYKVCILIANRFTDEGEPTNDWARAEKKWAQDQVYDVLSVSRPKDSPVAGYSCETATVTEAIAVDLLRNLGLFWSQMDFEFRIIE